MSLKVAGEPGPIVGVRVLQGAHWTLVGREMVDNSCLTFLFHRRGQGRPRTRILIPRNRRRVGGGGGGGKGIYLYSLHNSEVLCR